MSALFIIETTNMGATFWLHGTTWSFTRERADKFATRELAQIALLRAAVFAHKRIIKASRIIEA